MVVAVVKKICFKKSQVPTPYALIHSTQSIFTNRWSAPCATARLPTASSPAGTAFALAVSRSGTISVPNPLALCAVRPLTSRDFIG